MAMATKFAATAVLIATVACAIIAWALFEMRHDAIDTATSHIRDMATVLAEDVENSVATLDVSLHDAAEMVQLLASTPTISEADAQHLRQVFVRRRSLSYPLIFQVNESVCANAVF